MGEVTKISYAQYLDLIENENASLVELQKYVIPAPDSSGGFDPRVVHNPELVEDPEFEDAMSIGNGWSRRRRRKRFIRRVQKGSTAPVIVSEGDSWFQFPILIKDVVDHLEDDYLIWSLGAAGDTAENMIFGAPEYLEGLREHRNSVKAFMLSAAGNDVIGQDKEGNPVLPSLLHNFAAGKSPEQLVNKAALNRTLNTLQASYLRLIDTIRQDDSFRELPIIIHGYDYALAYPVGRNDKRRPFWAKKDQWLGRAFASRGINEASTRFEVIRFLIDRLYEMLTDVAATDVNVHVVDVRGSLATVNDWADEIHGTDEGFEKVAARFKETLERVITIDEGSSWTPSEEESEQTDLTTELDFLAIETHKLQDIDDMILGFGDTSKFGRGFAPEMTFEATVGADDTVPFWFLTEGAKKGKAVCKIEAQGVNFRGQNGRWSGTGFLIAPNILLTNSHVINSPAVAAKSRAVFNFSDKVGGGSETPVVFQIDPSRLFLASDPRDLDYCFVWVDGDAHEEFGVIPFWRGSFIGNDNDNANIIQHPNGEPKRVSVKENSVHTGLGAKETLIHYLSDTEPGSSGSPVMTDDWRLFALHHASKRVDALDSATLARLGGVDTRIVNEGIKTSAIAIDVELRSRDGQNAMSAREVYRQIRGIDSRTGFFGTLGRKVIGEHSYEQVVSSIRGAPNDIDVAFWNIEWFNRKVDEKLADVARVIADHNLDIWALEEVSPDATRKLVERLNQDFDQTFEFAASEPSASDGKQTTTVIWNSKTVEGERIEWPAASHEILKLDSRDPAAAEFEAVEGKLFNRYPGLFRFRAKTTTDKKFGFNLVPLHLKARSEGAKRRRMASNALARAIQIAAADDHFVGEFDWVIGGDMNAELSTGQFKGLTDAGFSALSAADEADGAFTYLKHPYKTLIDSIFVSSRLMPKIGSDDFIIVAAERVYADFVNRVSDHRPVVLRLSLGDVTSNLAAPATLNEQQTSRADLFEAFVRVFREDPDGGLRTLADIID